MTMEYARAGIGNVGSYQVSGIPYLTGSTLLSASFATNEAEQKFEFSQVSKAITVINISGVAIKIHYNSIAATNVVGGHHYVTLSGSNTSITMYHRCKEIYVSLLTSSADADFEIVADLTTIDAGEMFTLTGSGLTI